jgi:outer membrane protein assembly factor BamB
VRTVHTTISCSRSILLCALVAASSRLVFAQSERSSLPLALRWTIDVGAPPVAGALPVSDDHFVYIALRTGQIAAYDLADGTERWRKAVKVAHPLATDSNLLFVATEDTILALRSADGALVWEAQVAATAPLLARGGWLLAMVEGNLVAFRAADGSRAWQQDIGATSVGPAINGDRVFAAPDDGRIVAVELKTGKQIWERGLGGAAETPLPTDLRVYAGASDLQLYCLDAATGEIRWQTRLGAAPQGSAAADSTRVFIVSLDNLIRAYDLRNGGQRWQHGLKHRPATGTVALGGMVLVGSAATPEIWAWAAASGKPAGTIATPAEPAVPPSFVDRGGEGAFVFVVTGGLANHWQLTLLATAGDPPLVPLSELPGQALESKR